MLILKSAFILVALVYMWGYDLPQGHLLRKVTRRHQKWLVWIGLTHNWAMFAPNPISTNEKFRFDLTYADGKTEEIVPDFFDRLEDEVFPGDVRDLKFEQSLGKPKGNALKPGFCRFVARTYATRTKDSALTRIDIVKLSQKPPKWPPDAHVPNWQFMEKVTYTHHLDTDPIWIAEQERV